MFVLVRQLCVSSVGVRCQPASLITLLTADFSKVKYAFM